MNYYLDHERLDVYQFAIQFVVLADEIVENMPRGRAYLVDQLRRAGSSIPSATECSSILDILRHLQLIEEQLFSKARELLVRTVAMLIKMVQRLSESKVAQGA